jgi:hypothetical protein
MWCCTDVIPPDKSCENLVNMISIATHMSSSQRGGPLIIARAFVTVYALCLNAFQINPVVSLCHSAASSVWRDIYFLPDFLMPCCPVFMGPLPPAFLAISSRAFLSVARQHGAFHLCTCMRS